VQDDQTSNDSEGAFVLLTTQSDSADPSQEPQPDDLTTLFGALSLNKLF